MANRLRNSSSAQHGAGTHAQNGHVAAAQHGPRRSTIVLSRGRKSPAATEVMHRPDPPMELDWSDHAQAMKRRGTWPACPDVEHGASCTTPEGLVS